jgi:hypothetical protein
VERHQRGRGRPPDGGRAAKAKDRPTGVPPRLSRGRMLSCKPNLPALALPKGARQWGVLLVHRPGPRQGAAPSVPGAAPRHRPLALAQPMPLPLLFLLFARSAHFAFAVVFARPSGLYLKNKKRSPRKPHFSSGSIPRCVKEIPTRVKI